MTGKAAALDKVTSEMTLNQTVNSDLVKLFQRSQGIQGLRDGMYRVCEGWLNGAIDTLAYQKQLTNLVLTMNYLVSMEVCANLASTVKSIKELASDKEKSSTDTSIYHYETCLMAAKNFSDTLLFGDSPRPVPPSNPSRSTTPK
jgi:hypothetical protein